MRVVGNDMRITISTRSLENLRVAQAEGNNVPEFLSSKGYIRKDPCGCISSRKLYQLYRDWCQDNELMCLQSRSFSSYLLANCHELELEYTNRIPAGNDRLVRGFLGIRSVD